MFCSSSGIVDFDLWNIPWWWVVATSDMRSPSLIMSWLPSTGSTVQSDGSRPPASPHYADVSVPRTVGRLSPLSPYQYQQVPGKPSHFWPRLCQVDKPRVYEGIDLVRQIVRTLTPIKSSCIIVIKLWPPSTRLNKFNIYLSL